MAVVSAANGSSGLLRRDVPGLRLPQVLPASVDDERPGVGEPAVRGILRGVEVRGVPALDEVAPSRDPVTWTSVTEKPETEICVRPPSRPFAALIEGSATSSQVCPLSVVWVTPKRPDFSGCRSSRRIARSRRDDAPGLAGVHGEEPEQVLRRRVRLGLPHNCGGVSCPSDDYAGAAVTVKVAGARVARTPNTLAVPLVRGVTVNSGVGWIELTVALPRHACKATV